MRLNRTTLIMAGVLAIFLVIYLTTVYNKTESTIDREETAFGVRSADVVERIELTQYVQEEEQTSVELTRQSDSTWMVNGQYSANPTQVEVLLKTLENMEVKQPVNKAYKQNIFQDFKKRHIRAEIDVSEGRDKTIFVGGPTQDHTGTIMMLKGAKAPYIVEYPGFVGYLTPRFRPKLDVWRENLLFNATRQQLAQVEVRYPVFQKGFSLRRSEAGWGLASGESLDSTRLNAYLEQFQGKVYARSYAGQDFPGVKDSLQNVTPEARLVVQRRDGEQRAIRFFDRPDDPNTLFGWVEGDGRLLLIQHAVIDRFLVKTGFLRGKESPGQPAL